MSLGKDIQRAEKKIEVLETQVKSDDVLKAELAGQIEKLNADVAAAVKTGADAVAVIQAESEKVKAELEAQIKVAGEKEVITAAELEKVRAELKSAQAKMANPAFADATAKGETKAVEATTESGKGVAASWFAQYAAISDPVERSKFWDTHRVEMQAEAKASSQA